MKIDMIVSRHHAAVEFVARQLAGEGRKYHVSKVGEALIGVTLYTPISEDERAARCLEAAGLGDEYHGLVDDQVFIPVLSAVTAEQVTGKVVAGNLPMNLAAMCREVLAIEFSGTAPRGAEYDLAAMDAAGARLVSYTVVRSDQHELVEVALQVVVFGWLLTMGRERSRP